MSVLLGWPVLEERPHLVSLSSGSVPPANPIALGSPESQLCPDRGCMLSHRYPLGQSLSPGHDCHLDLRLSPMSSDCPPGLQTVPWVSDCSLAPPFTSPFPSPTGAMTEQLQASFDRSLAEAQAWMEAIQERLRVNDNTQGPRAELEARLKETEVSQAPAPLSLGSPLPPVLLAAKWPLHTPYYQGHSRGLPIPTSGSSLFAGEHCCVLRMGAED